MNGSQTFLKRVVSKCSWSSLYCNKAVSYVIDSRPTYSYRFVTKKIYSWSCCPGFSGENCDEVCFNCTMNKELRTSIQLLTNKVQKIEETCTNVAQIPGLPGIQGIPGHVGPPGLRGSTGITGPIGREGIKGEPGSSGLPGHQGERGIPGKDGRPGDKGLDGQKGEPGISGFHGDKGAKGNKGKTGIDGKPGTKGKEGNAGPPGKNGNRGSAGIKGEKGMIGVPGIAGVTGPKGPPGPPGKCQMQPMGLQQVGMKTADTIQPFESSISIFVGPFSINYCQDNKLWKRPIVQLSCDFDIFALNKYSWSVQNQKEKGTFCFFENSNKKWSDSEKIGKWKLSLLRWNPKTEKYTAPNHVLTFSRSAMADRARLSSVFFQLPSRSPPICLFFRFSFRGNYEHHCRNNSSKINVFLFPCQPAYRVPVLSFQPSDRHWHLATVPLPHSNHPYQVLIEGISHHKKCQVMIDEVVFSDCNTLHCMYNGQVYSDKMVWKSEKCFEYKCIEGDVVLKKISCPATNCKYSYKPRDYCCSVCCPYQNISNERNMYVFDDEQSNDEYDYQSSGDYYEYDNFLDDNGCPVHYQLSKRNKNFHVCDLPKDRGPCSGSFPKYHYNGSSCEQFEYGGCEGNANNFGNLEECHQTCVSSQLQEFPRNKIIGSQKAAGEVKVELKTYKNAKKTDENESAKNTKEIEKLKAIVENLTEKVNLLEKSLNLIQKGKLKSKRKQKIINKIPSKRKYNKRIQSKV